MNFSPLSSHSGSGNVSFFLSVFFLRSPGGGSLVFFFFSGSSVSSLRGDSGSLSLVLVFVFGSLASFF